MSDNKVVNKYENYVVCPYDKMHLLLPHRMAMHLTRCSRNHPTRKMVHCPFNTTHVMDPNETDVNEHILNCKFRISYEMYKMRPSEPKNCNKVLVESSEDWDAEPPVPTYDPIPYCLANNIIRTPQGCTPARRRKFREEERKRLSGNRLAKEVGDKKSSPPLEKEKDKDKYQGLTSKSTENGSHI